MSTIHPGQWRLSRVEVLNWGTFQGHWTVPVARQGFLVTGPSGSGKSSLLDAVSAVLTPRGKVRFNAAANDGSGRTEDRSLVSYVRGAWRRSADEETGEVASDYLRPGATHSGILLRYEDGTDSQPVLLVKLYHLRRGSNTVSDVQELSLILREDATLPEFAPHLGKGIDVRKIKSAWPDAVEATDKHSRFTARFSRLLGISGENAVLLLHKTQAAKSLGSLDDLFRTFMLDEPTTFAIADNAVAQFGELSQAHAAVVEARRQRDHLERMVDPARQYEEAVAAGEQAAELYGAVQAFKDAWKLRLAEEAHREAGVRLLGAEHDTDRAAEQVRDLYAALAVARQAVSDSGGTALETQRERIDLASERLSFLLSRHGRLAERLRSTGLAMPASFAEFEELRAVASRERKLWTEGEEQAQSRLLALHDARSAARRHQQSLEKDVSALRHRKSNLDRRLVEARTRVAEAAGLPETALPFAGELLEVRAPFADWAGAIERVLRPLATVMLVPRAHLAVVRRAVDSVHLGARLAYEDVSPETEPARRTDPDVSLVHRVDVAEHAMSGWLHHELARRFDYACVESADGLSEYRQVVTRAGQVKHSGTRYEKDDRSAIDDRSAWVLGFSNEAKLEHLLGRLQETREQADQAEKDVAAFSDRRDAERRRLESLELLDETDWDAIDVPAAEASLAAQRARLEELLAASEDLRRAQASEHEADARHEAARRRENEFRQRVNAAAAELHGLEQVIIGLRDRADTSPVPEGTARRLEELFTDRSQRRRISHDVIDDVAFAVGKDLSTQERRQSDLAARAAQEFASVAHDFHTAWPAAAADLGRDIEDRQGYRQLHGRLVADGLPQFENRFFTLLQDQSQQNIAQLAAEIRRAPGEVRERIDPVNRSLARSAFDRDRYLRIQVKENRGEVGRQFLADLQEIATGSWTAQHRQEAERRFELLRSLMGRLSSSETADASWRRLCLDTRLHVRFTAQELDSGGAVQNTYDSSGGLSGGQQQKLVTFCLAAALRYQLTPEDELVPHYGTVMMDEAFDKADTNFTRMALDVFREFGFHMVLATPLKLLQTLSDYIGGVAAVRCVDFRDSRLATLDFEDALTTEEGAQAAQTLRVGSPLDGAGRTTGTGNTAESDRGPATGEDSEHATGALW